MTGFDLTIRVLDSTGRTLLRIDTCDASRRAGGRCVQRLPEGAAAITYGPGEPFRYPVPHEPPIAIPPDRTL